LVQNVQTSQELPHDEPRELALLSAVLGDARVLDLVRDIVAKDDFYDLQRGVIFDAMVQLHSSGDVVSRVTVMSWLKDRQLLDMVGGAMAIGRLASDIPVLGHAIDHARKIALKAKRRAFILDAEAKAIACRGNIDNEAEWLDEATRDLRKHADVLRPSNAISIRKSMDVFFQKLNRLANVREGVAGYSTGLRELDRLTAGWHGGHVTLVSGETSAGKSAFAIGQAKTVASSHQIEVVEVDATKFDVRVPIGAAVFTLEMEHDEVSQRLCCGAARVNWLLIETGEIGPNDLSLLAGASDELSQLPIYIDDDHDLTMTSFEAKVARIEAMFAAMGVRLGLVLIDYFQLVDVRSEGDKNANQEQRFNIAARRLKNFASRFRAKPKALPIIDGRVVDAGFLEPSRVAFGVLVQLNNGGNVRECKAVEMHAHNHWLIEAPTDEPDGPGATTRAKIKLKKQRGGKKNSVATCWRHDAYTLFTDDER
jgi:replicative DNA helicase